MRSLASLSIALFALSIAGCSQQGAAGSRDVAGTVTAASGQAITQVVAIEAGKDSPAAAVDVGAAGDFRLSLATGKRYRILFKDGDTTVGALRFSDGHGGFTNLLPIAASPSPTSSPQDASDGEDDDIGLGDVEDADGDDQYEPSEDPLDQVDSDGDGESDSDDADDDGDGEDDESDSDDDNNGVDDSDEDGDSDDDGIDDEVESEGEGGSDGGGGEGGGA